ncbi:hypothetical protein B0O41_1967 [Propionibacteriaceae bacterium ES.041]|uniref:Uncharacterized protein n=1 Tax=Enemella evansiae TaxID=2016499 RepID=A0A255G5B5_9ACTN|nr:hypothetical protein [Enemella evansiae]PFG67155.1 hypothetical protein B0O41_1967 [Propionibacteriaceae bacterium ES.041]OYN98439.1 hypothetical protein CGZ95_13765 [Enemella evansiae]OYN99447.1 hypothetical protein CGZ96_08670 [Enemella evansiae]OYO10761.1 hypothetical protein CGZ94_16405 [Enemella evansiae]OYO15747.1 hypothetical protein CGZ98_03195 [Enemella evansiae]
MAAPEIEFLKGVSKLHAFYAENVRMLAEAYGLPPETAARVLDNFGYHNVAREMLRPPQGDAPEDENLNRKN